MFNIPTCRPTHRGAGGAAGFWYTRPMKQVIVIHGGDSFPTYEAYISSLKDKIIDLDRLRPHASWKASLPGALGSDYDVLTPTMPNASNARYDEWQIWFEKLVPFLHDDVILVGHSLGACFLTRYLAENPFPVRIAATLLVAGVYSADNAEMTEEFAAPASLALLAEQGGRIFLYHSQDDPVVPFAELAKYQAALPHATTRVFTDRQHFNQDTFPELVADIRSL